MFDFLAHCFTIWAGLFLEPNQPLLRSWYFVRTSRMLTMFMSISYWRPWRRNGICNPAFEQSLGMPWDKHTKYLKQKISPPGSIISHHVSCVSWPPYLAKKPTKTLVPTGTRGAGGSDSWRFGSRRTTWSDSILQGGFQGAAGCRDFSPKKNNNQNGNVSMCHLESDGDGFILFGQARWRDVVFVCFCGWKLLCNKKSMNKLVMISSRLSMEAPWGRADWHWCGF